MKTTSIFRPSQYLTKAFMAFAVLFGLLITACNKDKDNVVPQAPFAGNYEGTKANGSKYTMTIEHKGGISFGIKNFGGFLNATLNATATGNTLSIPTQTFTNPNGKQLILSGTATLSEDASELSVDYSVGGFTEYDGEMVVKRKAK